MTRDDVLKEFDPRNQLSWHWDALDIAEVMADEIVRLREALKHETQWADAGIDSTAFWQQQRDDLAKKLAEVTDERDAAEANAERRWDDIIVAAKKIDRLQAILAALREPSFDVRKAAWREEPDMEAMLRAAVKAAEQEASA